MNHIKNQFQKKESLFLIFKEYEIFTYSNQKVNLSSIPFLPIKKLRLKRALICLHGVREFPLPPPAVADSVNCPGWRQILMRICRHSLRNFPAEKFLAHFHPFESPSIISILLSSIARITILSLCWIFLIGNLNLKSRVLNSTYSIS